MFSYISKRIINPTSLWVYQVEGTRHKRYRRRLWHGSHASMKLRRPGDSHLTVFQIRAEHKISVLFPVGDRGQNIRLNAEVNPVWATQQAVSLCMVLLMEGYKVLSMNLRFRARGRWGHGRPSSGDVEEKWMTYLYDYMLAIANLIARVPTPYRDLQYTQMIVSNYTGKLGKEDVFIREMRQRLCTNVTLMKCPSK